MRDCVLSAMRHQKYVAEDLFSYKGFRGEALLQLLRCACGDENQTRPGRVRDQIIVEGSKFVSQEVAVLPKGTSFAVKIFFFIPARRNFLKSDTVEYRHIIDEFQRVALAHPNIYFTFFIMEAKQFASFKHEAAIVNVFW
jgi:DNA mismatch repair protein MutL